jgi:hypothetical protein
MEVLPFRSPKNFSKAQNSQRTLSRAATSQGGRRRKGREDGERPLRNHLNSQLDAILRKMIISGTITATAGGLITMNSISSSQVSTSTDWSSASGLYSQYRVRQIILRMIPTQTTSSPLTSYQIAIAMARYYGTSTGLATSFNHLAAEPGSLIKSSLEEFRMETNFSGFPDGQLWTAANTSIAATETYGFNFRGTGNVALVASSVVFEYVVEYFVEFATPY